MCFPLTIRRRLYICWYTSTSSRPLGLHTRDVNKDLTLKDQDKDKDLTPKNKDKDLTPKDQDKDHG